MKYERAHGTAIHVVAIAPQSIACCRLRAAIAVRFGVGLLGVSQHGWSVINYHSGDGTALSGAAQTFMPNFHLLPASPP
jgi:hypothetical protein